MQFNFAAIVEQLNARLPKSDNFAFRIARASVIPNDYVLNTILPQELRPDYHVDGGTMTITPTMLGLVAMDSPYPPFGAISTTSFFENSAKIGGHMFFPEKALRDLQAWIRQDAALGMMNGNMGAATTAANARTMESVIGFANMVVKAHWDTYEWLRGQALSTGAISWTFNKIPLSINYNVPAANKPAQRTGTARYNGSASEFWNDIRFVFTKLSNPRFIMNENTWLAIIGQDANKIDIGIGNGATRTIRRYRGDLERPSTDARDMISITVYNKSGSVIDAKTGTLTAKQFIPDGIIICVGEATPAGFELTQGSVANPDNTLRLGYTHLAPTVEGGGVPGIWSRVYTPEGKPMQLMAETAANMLPVVLNPNNLVILNTALA